MGARYFMLAASLAVVPAALVGCGQDTPTAAETTDQLSDASAPVLHRARVYSEWAPAIRVEDIPGTHPEFNGPFLDGCPFISADGKTFYMASNRPGGLGGIDIWVVTRERRNDPWGEPVNVGAPVNTEHNDFCPTLASDGRTFYFASNRPGGCGGDDLYVTRRRGRGHVYDAPRNLGCQVNSAANEAGPSPVFEPGAGLVLYFSSFRVGGFAPEAEGATSGDSDLYRSEWHRGAFGPAELVPGVNTAFNDGQPNVRRDSREIFFFSNRTGTLGGNDIYAATRRRARDVWSTPFNLGPNVNGPASETRPSLSWDGRTLYFGSDRPGPTAEGSSDHYVTTRERLTRSDD